MSDCSIYVRRMEEKNISPMPIIGLYVAVASVLCIYSMVRNSAFKLDLDFSAKFFALNATWLTLLAVATKLTGDLTSPMWSPQDNIAKITTTAFLTMFMGNIYITLGSMNNTNILANLTALSILVITVFVDLCIQLSTGALDSSLFPEIIYAMILLFCMLLTIVSSALAVPAIKKLAESKYQKLASDKGHMERQQHTVEELRLSITKYWVMAASGSPQFLMKRLVTFTFSCIVSLLSALVFLLATLRLGNAFDKWIADCQQQQSDYNWSVMWIILSQYSAMGPTVIVVKFIFEGVIMNIKEFTVESYWTEKLMEWRQCPIPMRIKKRKIKKLLHKIKGLILTVCILVQTIVVVVCIVSSYSMRPLVLLVNHLGNFFHKSEVSNDQGRLETHLNSFVILLEGEKQFPNRLLRKIINNVDKYVEMGKMQRPQNLFNLLNENSSFSGMVEFDSNRVPSLLSDEPPNCWTLPVVTLTTIAIALPNIASQHVDWLVTSVDEGLCYARIIDVLDEKCGLKSIQNVADVWVGVELYKKWFGMDLERKIGEVSSTKEIILTLADVAKRIVIEFSSTENKVLVENPLYWPANVLAANSMYRTSQTILLYYENSDCQAEELFRKLISMIADILTACLTNLPHVIATKCICNTIEEREKSVRDAAILLGETEDILKRFEEHQLSCIGPSQPLCIDEWHQWMERQDPTVSTSATSNETPSTIDSNEHLIVQI